MKTIKDIQSLNLYPEARVWLYQFKEQLGPEQQDDVQEGMRQFTSSVSFHGTPINATAHIW